MNIHMCEFNIRTQEILCHDLNRSTYKLSYTTSKNLHRERKKKTRRRRKIGRDDNDPSTRNCNQTEAEIQKR
jgi:hypothetical protein